MKHYKALWHFIHASISCWKTTKKNQRKISAAAAKRKKLNGVLLYRIDAAAVAAIVVWRFACIERLYNYASANEKAKRSYYAEYKKSTKNCSRKQIVSLLFDLNILAFVYLHECTCTCMAYECVRVEYGIDVWYVIRIYARERYSGYEFVWNEISSKRSIRTKRTAEHRKDQHEYEAEEERKKHTTQNE